MRRCRLAGGFIAMIMCLAVAAGAQRVSGTVRDSASGRPLAGATVTSIGSTAAAGVRAVTDANGRFSLAAVRPTSVRVIRIGYRPSVASVAADTEVEIRLVAITLELETIQVQSSRRCPVRTDDALADSLWSRVRRVLARSIESRHVLPATLRVVRYWRSVDYVGRQRIDSQTTSTRVEAGKPVTMSEKSAAVLAGSGFAVARASGIKVYAPDESVLLDTSFARVHCFTVAHSNTPAGEIGVAFAPTPDDDTVAGLAGVAWLDGARTMLDSVPFRYTNVRGSVAGSGRSAPGGVIRFARAPNDVPFVVSWELRQPQGVKQVQWAAVDGVRGHGIGQVVSLNDETGAVVVDASWPDGTSWRQPLSTLSGVVVDLKTNVPRAGVAVQLINADRTSVSDASGAFQFDDLLPGPYTIAIADTLLAVFHSLIGGDSPKIEGGLRSTALADHVKLINGRFEEQPLVRAIQVDSGPMPPVRVRLPDPTPTFRHACGRVAERDSIGIIAAWVIDRGARAAGATVRAQWISAETIRQISVVSDQEGRALLCDLPTTGVVALSVALAGGPTRETVVELHGPRVALATVEVR